MPAALMFLVFGLSLRWWAVITPIVFALGVSYDDYCARTKRLIPGLI